MRRLERVYQNGTLAEVDQEELVASFQRTAGQPLSSHSATVSDRQPTAKSCLPKPVQAPSANVRYGLDKQSLALFDPET